MAGRGESGRGRGARWPSCRAQAETSTSRARRSGRRREGERDEDDDDERDSSPLAASHRSTASLYRTRAQAHPFASLSSPSSTTTNRPRPRSTRRRLFPSSSLVVLISPSTASPPAPRSALRLSRPIAQPNRLPQCPTPPSSRQKRAAGALPSASATRCARSPPSLTVSVAWCLLRTVSMLVDTVTDSWLHRNRARSRTSPKPTSSVSPPLLPPRLARSPQRDLGHEIAPRTPQACSCYERATEPSRILPPPPLTRLPHAVVGARGRALVPHTVTTASPTSKPHSPRSARPADLAASLPARSLRRV